MSRPAKPSLPGAVLLLLSALGLGACDQFGVEPDDTFGGGGGGGGVGDDDDGDPTYDIESYVGEVIVDGERCPVDEGDLKGYCLQSSTTFSSSGSNSDCAALEGVSATAWLAADALDHDDSFELDFEDNQYASGEGSVWINTGLSASGDTGGDESYASGSGTAWLTQVEEDLVEVSFEVELVTFIGQDPGPSASGTVYCKLAD